MIAQPSILRAGHDLHRLAEGLEDAGVAFVDLAAIGGLGDALLRASADQGGVAQERLAERRDSGRGG